MSFARSFGCSHKLICSKEWLQGADICLCCFSEASEQNKSEKDEREGRMSGAKTQTLSCLFLQPLSACVTIRSIRFLCYSEFFSTLSIFFQPSLYCSSVFTLCVILFSFSLLHLSHVFVCCLKVSCSFETSAHYFSFLLRTLTFFSKFLFSLSSNQHAW